MPPYSKGVGLLATNSSRLRGGNESAFGQPSAALATEPSANFFPRFALFINILRISEACPSTELCPNVRLRKRKDQSADDGDEADSLK